MTNKAFSNFSKATENLPRLRSGEILRILSPVAHASNRRQSEIHLAMKRICQKTNVYIARWNLKELGCAKPTNLRANSPV